MINVQTLKIAITKNVRFNFNTSLEKNSYYKRRLGWKSSEKNGTAHLFQSTHWYKRVPRIFAHYINYQLTTPRKQYKTTLKALVKLLKTSKN